MLAMDNNLLKELDSSEKNSLGLILDAGAIEGLKKMPVDVFEGIYLSEVYNNALILCVDVRNFSDFLCSNDEYTVFKLIKEFTSNLLSCINQYGYGCSYYKLMGDGALVIWDEMSEDAKNEALTIFDLYAEFLEEHLFEPFEKLSLAGALIIEKVFKYEISAELSELKYRDYVGYGINLACRLQMLASAKELVLNEALAKLGSIPFKVSETPKTIKDMLLLKGLKEEDRKRVLIYKK
jgi:class 3 adenylate cyclase